LTPRASPKGDPLKRLAIRIVWIAAVVVVLGATAAFVWDVVRIGDTAERESMAMGYLDAACCDFIAAHHDWPRSWDELEKTTPSVGHVTLPRDLPWVEQLVFVDFQANLKDIA
jgi:hypothetical protein